MAAAGLAMIVAHALFKSTLFLTVGVIDHATGTRDLRVLSGLGRRLPVLAVIGGLAGASMAGVPPLLGFVGKEAAFTALLDGGLPDRTVALLELAGLVLGSVITAAYTFRFLWGAFARKPGCAETEVAHPPAALFLAAPAVLAAASLLLGPASPLLEPLVAGYAEELPLIAPEAEELALWHGLQPALALSAITLLGGYAIFALRAPINRFQRRMAVGASADEGYWNVLQGLDRLSVLVTGTTQRGSLPAYLGTILAVVLALPGSVLLFRAPWPGEWRAWDTPIQALVGAVVLIAAVLALRIRQRLSRGARRRRHRLRGRRPVRAPGRTRSRAHPVPHRDAHPGRLRPGPAQAAQGHHRPPPPPRARRPRRDRRGRRAAHGLRGRRRPQRTDRDAGLRGLPGAGLPLRRRARTSST